jgi:mannonate dehydratase
MSTSQDFQSMFDAVDLPANGMTFCTGSLGARADNDLPQMARRLGPRIHFAHLRNVRRETEAVPCSFFEDNHLSGSTNMVRVIQALVAEETRRKLAGETVTTISMRPDHGHELLTDIGGGGNPGYTAIGRLRGLAELRGVMMACEEILT